jgi:hypothetical protein
VAVRLLRYRAHQPDGPAAPGPALGGGLPGDLLLAQQRSPRRPPAPPTAARGVPQHDGVPVHLRRHAGLLPLPGDLAGDRGRLLRLRPTVGHVPRLPRGADADTRNGGRARGDVVGHQVGRLVAERAVQDGLRHERLPDRDGAGGAQDRCRERDFVQPDIQEPAGSGRRRRTSRKDRYAELYAVRWTLLMAPPALVLAMNVTSMVAAVVGDGSTTVVAVAFNAWVVAHLYPFELGLMGRWSKNSLLLLVAFFTVRVLCFVQQFYTI